MAGDINWVQFAGAVLVIELTPGPNMAWLAALSLGEGRRAGMAATLGIAIGLMLNAMLAAMGLVALIAARPGLEGLLRWAGVGLMLGLGVQGWRGADVALGPDAARGARGPFVAGLLMNLFNPKALLFFVVVVPPFLGGRAPSVAQAMGLAAISTAIATMVHAAIVTGAAHAHERLGNRRWLGRVRRAMALVMLAMALVLALGLA